MDKSLLEKNRNPENVNLYIEKEGNAFSKPFESYFSENQFPVVDNFDENTSTVPSEHTLVHCETYKRDRLRELLYLLLCVITLGVFPLVIRNFPHARFCFRHKRSSIAESDCILLRTAANTYHVCSLKLFDTNSLPIPPPPSPSDNENDNKKPSKKMNSSKEDNPFSELTVPLLEKNVTSSPITSLVSSPPILPQKVSPFSFQKKKLISPAKLPESIRRRLPNPHGDDGETVLVKKPLAPCPSISESSSSSSSSDDPKFGDSDSKTSGDETDSDDAHNEELDTFNMPLPVFYSNAVKGTAMRRVQQTNMLLDRSRAANRLVDNKALLTAANVRRVNMRIPGVLTVDPSFFNKIYEEDPLLALLRPVAACERFYSPKKGLDDNEGLTPEEMEHRKTKMFYFDFRCMRFIFDVKSRKFVPLEFDVCVSSRLLYSFLAQGLNSDTVIKQRHDIFGDCSLNPPIPSIWELILDEVLHPFYLFQILSVGLWIVDDYLSYAIAIAFIMIVSSSIELYETYCTMKRLHKLVEHHTKVKVWRMNDPVTNEMFLRPTPVEIDSAQIVPGDILEIKTDSTIICDCVLLQGSVVIDESMLTGEGVPTMKSMLPREFSSQSRLSLTRDGRHILYAGTKVLQSKPSAAKINETALVSQTSLKRPGRKVVNSNSLLARNMNMLNSLSKSENSGGKSESVGKSDGLSAETSELGFGSRLRKEKEEGAFLGGVNAPKLPSENAVLALCCRTGFTTQQGKLLRSILFPRPSRFDFTEDALLFVAWFAFAALIGAIITFIVNENMGVSIYRIIIRCSDIFTTSVPPALPAALSVGITFAAYKLRTKWKVSCLLPDKINTAGRVKFILFDKTGTLTEEGLDFVGLVPIRLVDTSTKLLSPPLNLLPSISPSTASSANLRKERDASSFLQARKNALAIPATMKSVNAFAEKHANTSRMRETEEQKSVLTSSSSDGEGPPNTPVADGKLTIPESFAKFANAPSPTTQGQSPGINTKGSSPTASKIVSESGAYVGRLLTKSGQLGSVHPDIVNAMSTCHDLAHVNGEVRGDPIDELMFDFTGWRLEEPSNGAYRGVAAIVRPPNSMGLEAKLREMSSKNGLNESSNIPSHTETPIELGIVRRFEFSSVLQRMSVVVRDPLTMDVKVFVKGSPEKILELCNRNSIPFSLPLTLRRYTRNGMRVIAFAGRNLGQLSGSVISRYDRSQIECDLTILGLLVFANKLKPESSQVVRELKEAKCHCAIVTGDNPLTALAVGRACKLVDMDQKVVLYGDIFSAANDDPKRKISLTKSSEYLLWTRVENTLQTATKNVKNSEKKNIKGGKNVTSKKGGPNKASGNNGVVGGNNCVTTTFTSLDFSHALGRHDPRNVCVVLTGRAFNLIKRLHLQSVDDEKKKSEDYVPPIDDLTPVAREEDSLMNNVNLSLADQERLSHEKSPHLVESAENSPVDPQNQSRWFDYINQRKEPSSAFVQQANDSSTFARDVQPDRPYTSQSTVQPNAIPDDLESNISSNLTGTDSLGTLNSGGVPMNPPGRPNNVKISTEVTPYYYSCSDAALGGVLSLTEGETFANRLQSGNAKGNKGVRVAIQKVRKELFVKSLYNNNNPTNNPLNPSTNSSLLPNGPNQIPIAGRRALVAPSVAATAGLKAVGTVVSNVRRRDAEVIALSNMKLKIKVMKKITVSSCIVDVNSTDKPISQSIQRKRNTDGYQTDASIARLRDNFNPNANRNSITHEDVATMKSYIREQIANKESVSLDSLSQLLRKFKNFVNKDSIHINKEFDREQLLQSIDKILNASKKDAQLDDTENNDTQDNETDNIGDDSSMYEQPVDEMDDASMYEQPADEMDDSSIRDILMGDEEEMNTEDQGDIGEIDDMDNDHGDGRNAYLFDANNETLIEDIVIEDSTMHAILDAECDMNDEEGGDMLYDEQYQFMEENQEAEANDEERLDMLEDKANKMDLGGEEEEDYQYPVAEESSQEDSTYTGITASKSNGLHPLTKDENSMLEGNNSSPKKHLYGESERRNKESNNYASPSSRVGRDNAFTSMKDFATKSSHHNSSNPSHSQEGVSSSFLGQDLSVKDDRSFSRKNESSSLLLEESTAFNDIGKEVERERSSKSADRRAKDHALRSGQKNQKKYVEELIHEEEESLFIWLLRNVRVFARMSPDDKTSLVASLQELPEEPLILMCGDGANDCSALRQADIGLALSDTDASIAAPFTSNNTSLTSILDILREGRSALITSFDTFKYILLYSAIQYCSVLSLYLIGNNLSDNQYMWIDNIVVLLLACLMNYTEASSKLSCEIPPSSLSGISILGSVAGQSVIQITVQLITMYITTKQWWYEPFIYEKDDDPEDTEEGITCHLNTVIFLISNFQYILTAFIYSASTPFRKRIWTNKLYLLAITILFIISILIIIVDVDDDYELPKLLLFFSKYTNVSHLPRYFRMILLLIVLINFILSVIYEELIILFVDIKNRNQKLPAQQPGVIVRLEKVNHDM